MSHLTGGMNAGICTTRHSQLHWSAQHLLQSGFQRRLHSPHRFSRWLIALRSPTVETCPVIGNVKTQPNQVGVGAPHSGTIGRIARGIRSRWSK